METGGVPSRRAFRWSTKKFILAAMFGIMTTTALATAITLVLRPVNVSFSVTHATMSAHVGPHRRAAWAFTLVATNPSRRAGVRYLMLSASVYFPVGHVFWILQAGFPTPLYQPPRNMTGFPMSFSTEQEGDDLFFYGRPNASLPMDARVTARMQFKVGPCYSVPYEMTVLCKHIFSADNGTSTHRQGHLPVNCTVTDA